MECQNCQTQNPDVNKFCRECGAELSAACPQCAAEVHRRDRFCGNCGHKLDFTTTPSTTELSFDEKLTKIQRYLPRGLTEKVLSQRDRIEGERRQVTVMFCDMAGFTVLSDILGPEEAYAVMDQIYEILIHKVNDFEGTVNEMTGDGIMALFGAPVALEDAPQRAIRSAYAIHREMARFSEKIKQNKKNIPQLKMRVGIHTGPVVVGSLGNDLRVEFKAVGDTVNLASRMESLAEPGSTYVTEQIFALTEGLFRFEALGELAIKGKEDAIKTYRVIAPSTRRTRFDVSAERGLTPLVGRMWELDLLLDAFKRSKEGHGQVVSIVSEAGIGKSRVLYEFRKAVANEDVTFLEGRCLSYSRGVVYHPLIDILKSIFKIRESDDAAQIQRKVNDGLQRFNVDEALTLPYLLKLLSIDDSDIDVIAMSPEERKNRIFEAIKNILLKRAQRRPLIVALEDLHWIDKSSLELLGDFVGSIPGVRILIICTFRPEFMHSWSSKSYHSQIFLKRLTNDNSLEMVTHLLGTGEPEKELEDLILKKAEGIPFFIEEFIRSLIDLEILQKDNGTYQLSKDTGAVTIPSTIQDVIMARVDAQPEGAKWVLQTGSVIEREFSLKLISCVLDLPEQELMQFLSVLKDAELLYERGIYPHSTYIFKHNLTREVVYESILKRNRRRLHEHIGNAVEEIYQDNIEAYYGVLAEHYITSENYEKGARYSRLAERRTEKAGSLVDAIEYARKRINCLEKLPQSDELQKELIDARTVLGLYSIQIGYHAAAKEAVQPILDLAKARGYKRRLSQIFTIMGTYHFQVEEDFDKAFNYLEDALIISQELNDMVSILFSNFWLAIVRAVNCEFEKAVSHFDKALEINLAANSLWGTSIMKSNLSYFIFYFQGGIDLSYQTSKEALQGANASGDIFSKAMASVCHGIACYGRGLIEKAIEHLSEGREFCEKINLVIFHALAHFFLGESYYEMGDFETPKQHFSTATRILKHNQIIPSWKNTNKLAMAKTRVMNGEQGIDLESLYGIVNDNKAKIWDGWIRRCVGEILLNIDEHHMVEAQDWIIKAIEADQSNGVLLNLGKNYALYAELLRRKGDSEAARKNMQKAIEIFRNCGADGTLRNAEKKLASIS